MRGATAPRSFIMVGNRADAATREPGVPTIHAVQDPGSLIRDFTKWDDNPQSLQHFAESAVRAYKIAMTPPHEPVLMVLEEKLQEDAIEKGAKPLVIPKLNMVAPPAGDPNAVREAAQLLAMADNPVIVADRVGAHARRHQASGRTRRSAECAGDRSARPHEHAEQSPSLSTSAAR